jgi:biotin transport system substrate-specific component
MFQQAVLTVSKKDSWVRSLFLVLGGSFLIALFARISIPLPFSPVPIALQGVICLILGAMLGRRLGALSVLAYLAQGAIGLPVFALGKAGLPILLGPTGGYLLGYLLGAYVTGYLIERSGSKSHHRLLLALTLGNLTIYLCGLPQLALFVGADKVFALGMLPFLVGDVVKLIIASRLLKLCQKFGRNVGEPFPS